MPGLSLSPHGITESRTANQMCRQDSRHHLSAEEAVAAEESLSLYCKPVELYNILGRRALHNPSFLQRCLEYKIKEKNKRRIHLAISFSWSMNEGEQVHNILPLHVLLGTPDPKLAAGGYSAIFRCRSQERILTCCNEFERKGCSKANFVLPEINQWSDESITGKLVLLFVSCGDKGNVLNDHMANLSSPETVGEHCLWGKIPVEQLSFSVKKCPSSSSETGDVRLYTIDMRSCFVESCKLGKEQCLKFKEPDNVLTMQVRVNVYAYEEVRRRVKSSYSLSQNPSAHTSILPHITRMRTCNVIFNYKYYNYKLQKTEVTEGFSCPFCLAKCACFEGLQYHLDASHDLFNFEFWVSGEYQAVNVSIKNEPCRSEIITDGSDPKLQIFYLCRKALKRTTENNSSGNAKHVHTCDQKLVSSEVVRNESLKGFPEKGSATNLSPMPINESPINTEPSNQLPLRTHDNDTHSSKETDSTPNAFSIENGLWNSSHTTESNDATNTLVVESLERVGTSPNIPGVSTVTDPAIADPECLPLESERDLPALGMLQFAKTRKLSADRSDPRNRMLLQKRQFFHSHRAQPMELEQVLSDRDSEDEVDDDVADFEDRRMLDDFVDVTKDEKQIMHLWNSFIRKQRVLADGHIPWACEAYSKLHGRELVQAPALFWCWKLFMIKLWNHSLLDSSTLDNCIKILDIYKRESLDTKLH